MCVREQELTEVFDCVLGITERDGEVAGDMEAPRSLLPPNGTRRYVARRWPRRSCIGLQEDVGSDDMVSLAGSKYERNLPAHTTAGQFATCFYP